MTRPTLPGSDISDAPSLRIYSGGTAISDTFDIASVVVIHEVNRISTAEILLYDGEPAQGNFPVSEDRAFVPGEKIRIEMGYAQNLDVIFEGVVINLRIQVAGGARSYFRIECKDEAYKLTLGRNNRYFYDQRDSEIIEAIARERGLRVSAQNTSVRHAEMVQYNATDWDFMLSRAEANGLMLFTRNGQLKAEKPNHSAATALELLYGATIIELDAEIDSRSQYGAVEAIAWDAANQALIRYNGRSSNAVSPGDLSTRKLAGDAGLDKLQLHHAGQLKGEELQAWAGAELERSELAKVRGRVRIQGFSQIKAGDIVKLDGLGRHFSGKAFVSGVRHEQNSGYWETDISFGLSPEKAAQRYQDFQPLPAEGLLPAVKGLHVAVVTKLAPDPEGEHRIRVRVPAIDTSGEGTWARIASLDAGNDRGHFFMPEIGDEVVVGFLHDDPRNPIVLGQLYSSKHKTPFTAQDTNHIKGYVSREKLKMTFDDEKKSFSMETPKGKKLILDDQAGEIRMEDEFGNKILLAQDGISIESAQKLTLKATADADMEGVNVNVKAQAQVKVSGGAGAELSASGNTVVKGAMVQIN